MTQNEMQNVEVKTSDVPEQSTLNKENEKEEKLFTQSQLEEIIRERLLRERKVNESLLSVKQLLKRASDKGLLGGESYAEMAKELVEKLGGSKPSKESSEEPAEQTAPAQTFAAADAEGEDNVRIADGNDREACQGEERASFVEILSDIKAKYPRTAVEKMLSGNNFERFAKGRSGDVREIFDDYYAFLSGFSHEPHEESDESHAELASTGFSSQSGMPDAGANLTKQQMDIAKSAGMSYREYAELLGTVPKRAGRNI